MSTIATTYIKHPSAGSPSLTLASSGAVAINGSMTGAGLDHITTQSFSAVSSVSIDNCFTSEYDNYRFSLNFYNETATTTGLYMRFRSNGSDYTGTTYTYLLEYMTNAGGPYRAYSVSVTNIQIGSVGDFRGAGFIEVFGPKITDRTISTGLIYAVGSSTNASMISHSTDYAQNSFDGFTLYPSSGTLTGKISVYGYKNS